MTSIQYYGTGKRKSSVARVFLRPGKGKIVVNKKELAEVIKSKSHQMIIRQPLMVTETESKFDVHVNVCGGGYNGQSGAIRHGITRALLEYNSDLRPALKAHGFTTRDPRKKERKKYGQPGARKKFQYSKR